VLLNEVPQRATLELVYMGVVPAFRRRGVGRALLDRALRLAANEGFDRLCLAADVRNEPAQNLYAAAGLQPVLQRDAWLCVPSDAREG
jgi:ribosomal protein S18 acetylase RimI-like enzyme